MSGPIGTRGIGPKADATNVGVSDLDPATALLGPELVAVEQGGLGVKTNVQAILDSNPYGGIGALSNAVAEATQQAFPSLRVIQAWTVDDPSNKITPSFAAGTLTVPAGGAGTYWVTATILNWTGSNSKTYGFGLLKNTDAFGFRIGQYVTSASGVGGSLTITAPIALVAGDVISLHSFSTDGGTLLVIAHGSLFMQRIGA